MVHDGPAIDSCFNVCNESSEVVFKKVGERQHLVFIENGCERRLMCDSEESESISNLNRMYCSGVFTRTRDVLFPNLTIVSKMQKSDVFQLFLEGYRPITYEEHSFVDQSSGFELNRDFMKLISILPVYLQAKGLNSSSAVVFLFIILFDFFSYFPNLIWNCFKKMVYIKTKLFISRFSVEKRVFLHSFLGTISDGFLYCDDSRKKTYFTNSKDIFIVEPCLLPSYIGEIVEFDLQRMVLNKIDQSLVSFRIGDDVHEFPYKHRGPAECTYSYKHILNGKELPSPGCIDEEVFEKEMF